MKAEGSYDQYKAKNALSSRIHRAKKKKKINSLSKEDKCRQIEERREKDRARQIQCRKKKKEKAISLKAIQVSPSHAAYTAPHSLSRALNRVKWVLPSSPRKRSTVIRKLSAEFGVTVVTPLVRKIRADAISDETVQRVKQFF